MANNDDCSKRRRITLGEAMMKQKETKSPQQAANWAIEEFQGVDLQGKGNEENVCPEFSDRIKSRISNNVAKVKRTHKKLSHQELDKPLFSHSEECLLDPSL
jgi:hypothetical protein